MRWAKGRAGLLLGLAPSSIDRSRDGGSRVCSIHIVEEGITYVHVSRGNRKIFVVLSPWVASVWLRSPRARYG